MTPDQCMTFMVGSALNISRRVGHRHYRYHTLSVHPVRAWLLGSLAGSGTTLGAVRIRYSRSKNMISDGDS